MKVLHIGKYFPPDVGGMEHYLRDLVVALDRRGVDGGVLVHRSAGSWRTVREDWHAGNVRIRVVRVASPARVVFAPVSPTFIFQLAHTIRDFQPDAVHIHMPNASALWALLLPAARRLPWIVHWHSDVVAPEKRNSLRWLYRLYRPIEKMVLKRCARVVATSQPYLDSSQSLERFRDKCHVIPLGLDPSRLADVAQVTGDPGPLRILAVGRLSYYKGFDYLVRSLEHIEGVHLDLVGEGDKRGELEQLVSNAGLQQKVSFHGELDDRELAAFYAKCDCLCLPSIERSEAFGLVLLEAMYYGKATVITDVPGSGMGWVVQDGLTGLHCRAGSVESLADALLRLRDDQVLVRTLGANGRARFQALFHIDRSAGAIAELYRDVARCGYYRMPTSK